MSHCGNKNPAFYAARDLPLPSFPSAPHIYLPATLKDLQHPRMTQPNGTRSPSLKSHRTRGPNLPLTFGGGGGGGGQGRRGGAIEPCTSPTSGAHEPGVGRQRTGGGGGLRFGAGHVSRWRHESANHAGAAAAPSSRSRRRADRDRRTDGRGRERDDVGGALVSSSGHLISNFICRPEHRGRGGAGRDPLNRPAL